jgi:hypothetical protein
VFLTLKSFVRQDEGNPNKLFGYQERIIEQSSFLREVVYKAQLLVNYYISSNANNVEYISNDIFEKNFWYRVCRFIYGNITIEEPQNFYPKLPGIQAAYNHLQEKLDDVNLLVEKQDLVGYGQTISSACDTIATAYNNFYVENYETYIGNYFIYRLKQEYNVSINKGTSLYSYCTHVFYL